METRIRDNAVYERAIGNPGISNLTETTNRQTATVESRCILVRRATHIHKLKRQKREKTNEIQTEKFITK